MSAGTLQDEIEALLENRSLSKWEEDFLRDQIEILDRGEVLSGPQREKVDEILNNYS